jgi:hypothetical protein
MNKTKFILIFLATSVGSSAFGMQGAFKSARLTALANGVKAHGFKVVAGVGLIGYSVFLVRTGTALRNAIEYHDQAMMKNASSSTDGDVRIDV